MSKKPFDPRVKTAGKLPVIGWMLLGGALVIGLIPVVGPGIAHLFDRTRSGMEAKAQKKALAKWYAPQIAAQLGISPDQVTYRELDQAAATNPTFRALIEKVNDQEKRDNRSSLVTAAIATPLALPGANLAVKAAEIPVTLAAGTVAGMMGKSHMMVDDVANSINQKRTQGQQVSADDVFMLNLAHDTALQDKIAKVNGKSFHKMDAAQQQAVMRSMPDMLSMAQKKAYALNAGLISEQDLTVQAGEEMKGGGFTNRVEAQRAQAQQMQVG